MIYTEHILKERLQKTQYCLAFDKCERTKLNTYSNMMDDTGGIDVNYNQPNIAIKMGRYFAEHGLSLQNFSKKLRHTLVHDTHTDIDMKNAHPQILYQSCLHYKSKLKIKHLKSYVDNREKYLKMFMDYFNSDRKTAKEMFLVIMYLGSWEKYLKEHKLKYKQKTDEIVKFIIDFKNELASIADFVCELIPETYIYLTANPIAGKSPKSSCLSYYLGDIENFLLKHSVEFLENKQIEVETLCFDGLLVLNNDILNDELLKELNKYVSTKKYKNGFKYNIQFEYKQMDEAITDFSLYRYKIPADRINIPFLADIKPDMKWIEKQLKQIPVLEKPSKAEQKLIKDIEKHNALCVVDSELYRKTDYFEKYHAKVLHPSCVLEFGDNDFRILKYSDVYNNYMNVQVNGAPFINAWFKDKMIRHYNKLDFLPHPAPIEHDTFNLFSGFDSLLHSPVSKSIDELAFFEAHLHVLCGKDQLATNYMMNYLAHLVQYAGILPKVACVFRSVQGTGKNIFFDNFGIFVLGRKYHLQTANLEDVIGRFNTNHNKLMVVIDEAQGKDTFSANEAIKNLITAITLNWEQKGVDSISIRNFGRYIIFSNNEIPVKIPEGDRRFIMFECANDFVGNQSYFTDFIYKLEYFARDIHDMLMSRDISNWSPAGDRYITDVYREVQSANIPIIALFFIDLCNQYCNEDEVSYEDLSIKSNELFTQYKQFLTKSGFTFETNIKKFGMEMTKYTSKTNGIQKNRKANGNMYDFDFKILMEYLISKNYVKD